MEDLKGRLDGLKTREKTRLAEIRKLEKLIADLQNRIDNPPEIENIEELQAEIVRTKRLHRETFTDGYTEKSQSRIS